MTYTERLNWWWSARRAYQSQEDFAAGKEAPEGVSCKYGIPGFLPGTRTPYVKPAPVEDTGPSVESKPTEDSTVVTTVESKPTEEAKTTPTENSNNSEDSKQSGTVNLIIPPGSSTLNVNKSNKKKKNKNKH